MVSLLPLRIGTKTESLKLSGMKPCCKIVVKKEERTFAMTGEAYFKCSDVTPNALDLCDFNSEIALVI